MVPTNMTDTPIPDDVMQAARNALKPLFERPDGCSYGEIFDAMTGAILAERERLEAEIRLIIDREAEVVERAFKLEAERERLCGEPTEAEVEAAARELKRMDDDENGTGIGWRYYSPDARAALSAAAKVRAGR